MLLRKQKTTQYIRMIHHNLYNDNYNCVQNKILHVHISLTSSNQAGIYIYITYSCFPISVAHTFVQIYITINNSTLTVTQMLCF